MIAPNYKRMLDTACRVGDEHARRAIASANEVIVLRKAIWRALILIRSGQIHQARVLLGKQIGKRHD